MADRPVQTELKTTSGTTLYRIKLSYDKQNRLKQYYDVVGGSAHKSDFTYDRVNRVTGVAYDKLGQLTRVNDPNDTTSGSTGTTWVYAYDRGGNITSKKRYAYTTGSLTDVTPDATVTYTYGDSNWKDKLTKYGSKTLAYDAIGNPTSDGTWTYAWQAGRQLKSMSKSGTSVTYKYDHNGLRVQKVETSGTKITTTAYTLNGSRVVYAKLTEKTDGTTTATNTMYFYYDAQGRPAKVNFNGTMYTYIHNLQGDIAGMLDGSGALVVEYKYDAWGKLLSTTGTLKTTLGKMNPFRYRGYVYDTETGLYYLRSRYYNPNWGRFVSSDSLVGQNQFAYAQNDSINHFDPDGTVAISIGIGGTFIAKGLLALLGSAVVGIASSKLISRGQNRPRAKTVKKFDNYISSVNETVADAIDRAMTKAMSSNYTGGFDSHHIVPKAMPDAAPARAILIDGGIDPQNDPRNQVTISKQLHKHLHSDYYVSSVNLAIGAVDEYCQIVYPGDKKKLERYLSFELVIISECLKTADLIVGSGFY